MQQIQHHTSFQRFALLLLVVVLIASGAFLLLSLFVVPPAATVAAAPAATAPGVIRLDTDLEELPSILYQVQITTTGYILTDPDGDPWLCHSLPVALADMEQCSYTGG